MWSGGKGAVESGHDSEGGYRAGAAAADTARRRMRTRFATLGSSARGETPEERQGGINVKAIDRIVGYARLYVQSMYFFRHVYRGWGVWCDHGGRVGPSWYDWAR